MKYLFLEYPKCSTCQRAKKWLDANTVQYVDRNIVTENPNESELTEWLKKSGLDLRKFFNTSGMLYKSMNLKEKLDQMSDKEKVALLATNGMLVKRPIVVADDFVLVGFKEKEWEDKLIK